MPEEQGWIGAITDPIPVKKYLTPEMIEQLETGDLKEETTNCPGEEHPHFTVIYGLKEESISQAASGMLTRIPKVVTISGLEVFNSENYDILVALIKKDKAINKMREEVMEFDHYEQQFPEYKPHITLCYLKKGTDPKEFLNNFSHLQNQIINVIGMEVDNPWAKLNAKNSI